jgi:hydroxymethylpyrimidine pyrophosphatase-like HAD family hydrolase
VIGASRPRRALTALWVTSRSSVRPASSSSSHGSMSLTTTIGCQPRAVLRAAYFDMDGTLLGAGGSLFHDAAGAFSMLGARALEACARAEVEVVPYSGRRRSTLLHDARLLGLRSYIFEAGCGFVLDGEVEWLAGEEDDSAANALLLERYAGRLEMYDPWQLGRESSRLYLGRDVDAGEADALLADAGHEHFRLVDNGAMHGAGGDGRAYHLIPRAASKAAAVARHMRARGYAPEECIAVGDSREDLGAADVVGTFWLVANALPEAHDAARATTNARVAEASHGAGVYEAVITELAERR